MPAVPISLLCLFIRVLVVCDSVLKNWVSLNNLTVPNYKKKTVFNSVIARRKFSPRRGLNVVEFWGHARLLTPELAGSCGESATCLRNISVVLSEWPLLSLLEKDYDQQPSGLGCLSLLSLSSCLLFDEPPKVANTFTKRKTADSTTWDCLVQMLARIFCTVSSSSRPFPLADLWHT